MKSLTKSWYLERCIDAIGNSLLVSKLCDFSLAVGPMQSGDKLLEVVDGSVSMAYAALSYLFNRDLPQGNEQVEVFYAVVGDVAFFQFGTNEADAVRRLCVKCKELPSDNSSVFVTFESDEEARQLRIVEIENRIDWMNHNLSGCDWCCGGGDEEMAALRDELKSLRG